MQRRVYWLLRRAGYGSMAEVEADGPDYSHIRNFGRAAHETLKRALADGTDLFAVSNDLVARETPADVYRRGIREANARNVEAQRTISELRAVLAPLLDEPWIDGGEGDNSVCRCCGATEALFVPQDAGEHAPGCPVLHKDELLGRN